jgi:hypothetical protein
MRFASLPFVVLLASLPGAVAPQLPDSLPDIDVLYIERTSRYPGYRPDYDLPGRQGVPVLADPKTRKPLTQAEAAAIKRWPSKGETVTFTAHVQNRGGGPAPEYDYVWLIDGKEVGRGKTSGSQAVGKETTATLQWRWQAGRHTVRFVADPLFKMRDQSLLNNSREDATDAWTLIWAVDPVTYTSFNKNRNFLGTRSFEDWAQWHIDHMNHLFDISPTPWDNLSPSVVGRRPSVPRPRIRCDKVVVIDAGEGVWDKVFGRGIQALDAGYDGAWPFGMRGERECIEWAANVDWGLIHEWGHQLGLTDLYALDRPGFLNEVADENGDPLLIGHMSSQVGYMMHGHGPTTFSPECMGALMTQFGRRRGYYGDYYFNIPSQNLLRVLDSQGKPVAGAKVTFWQDRDSAYSGAPAFSGTTDAQGLYLLPNRPAPHIKTELGYVQRDNPFGKINVVGQGDVFLIRIEARGQTDYAWLDIPEFNLAYWSTGPDRAVYSRTTHIPPAGAPVAPKNLRAQIKGDLVELAWDRAPGARGYRVYHARPDEYKYEEVKDAAFTVGSSCSVPLGNGALHRFAVTTLSTDRESAFSNVAGVMNLQRPWGIAVRKDGKRYVRDAHYGQAILQKPDGSFVGLVGSVHYHFEGSYDIAIDSRGRLVSAKWGDGYDPNPGFRVQDEKLNLVVDYRKPTGKEPGQVNGPMGVGTDSRDHIFIADTNNHRIQEFTPDGKFVQVIADRQVAFPMKVAFDRQDRMYVADSKNNRVAIFERQPDGTYKLLKGLLGGIKEPCYVAVDERGRIFVSTNRVSGVYMFDGLNGPEKPIWEWHGTKDDELYCPRGLAFDGKGNLLVVDESTRRVRSVKLP